MKPTLREAWSIITADDYDCHMAAVGQAQANAEIVHEFFRERPPATGSAVLFAGAGTGQMFDFVSPEFLRPFSVTFTDVNADYLLKLEARVSSCAGLNVRTVVGDIENSALSANFELVIAVLLLEHVDVARAIATMCCLATERVFIVVQENPPHLTSALTRPPEGTLAVLREAPPHLVSLAEVEHHFTEHGFRRSWTISRAVADEKKMVGVEFRTRPSLPVRSG